MRLTCIRGHSYKLTTLDLVALAISYAGTGVVQLGKDSRFKSGARAEALGIAQRTPGEVEQIEQKELEVWRKESGVDMAWYTRKQLFTRSQRAATRVLTADDRYIGDKNMGVVTPRMVVRLVDDHFAILGNSYSSEFALEPNFED